MAAYYVPSTPPPLRGRTYSSPYYPPTPFPGGAALSVPYTPGVTRSAPFYVAPTVMSGRRGRSHSRTRRSHSHHRSSHHHYHHGGHHHGRRGRSHSASAQRHYRNPPNYSSQRTYADATPLRHHHSPSLGSRILSFFGLGSSNRNYDQYGRGRTRHKY